MQLFNFYLRNLQLILEKFEIEKVKVLGIQGLRVTYFELNVGNEGNIPIRRAMVRRSRQVHLSWQAGTC
jgi:hypothetical protein